MMFSGVMKAGVMRGVGVPRKKFQQTTRGKALVQLSILGSQEAVGTSDIVLLQICEQDFEASDLSVTLVLHNFNQEEVLEVILFDNKYNCGDCVALSIVTCFG